MNDQVNMLNHSPRTLMVSLMTGFDGPLPGELIHRIRRIPGVKLQAVIHQNMSQADGPSRSLDARERSLWSSVKKCYQRATDGLQRRLVSAWELLWYAKPRLANLDEVCNKAGVALHRIPSLNRVPDPSVRSMLDCDLLCLLGPDAISPSLMSVPRIGTMSVAAEGLARHDRTIGARNANNDRVHEALVLRYYESAGAKQGILMDVQVPIFEYDTSQTIQAKLLETACDVLPKGIELIVQGGSCSESHPGKAASSALDETLKADHCSISSARPAKWLTAGRRLLRDVFYVLVLILHALKISGYRLFRRGTITILYYHRVSDVCQDGMTIGIHAFEKQIRFIKKHCQVWHADDLKTCLRQGGRVQGVRNVMITFDDGYEDNFTNALPILKRYDCPALFFISTGMIGTDNTFEHDRHLAPSLRFRNMTWPQVQEAQQSNIAIGVHSHTHADLGGVSHQTAVAEIEESISCFSRHLCQTPEWMSFPFGKIKNFNNELVTFVKQNTPIIGLFSANGHSNVGAIADYDIQRINIGYDDTGLTFIYKLSGGIQDLFRRSRPHPTEIVPAKRTRAGTVAQDLDSQSENHNRARAIDSRLRRG